MSHSHLRFSLCWLLILAISAVVRCTGETDMSRLRATLMKNYDKQARPVLNSKDVIDVNVMFTYMGLQFDDHNGKLTLHLLAQVIWQDQHIKWDPLEYGNITEMTFSPEQLWVPDLSVLNNFDESDIDHFANTAIFAATNYSGIWWYPHAKFQVRCQTNFKLWPYDKATCKVFLSSWAHNGGELNFTVAEGGETLELYDYWYNGTENREWRMTNNSVRRFSRVAYCCPQVDFIYIEIAVTLERKSNAHTAAVTVVGLGIAMSILISFWLDPFANERIPLTLLLMIVNSMYLQFMHKTIPNNGTVVPLTICFFRDSLILLMFAFGWIIMIRYLANAKRNSPVPLPDFVGTFLDSFMAKLLCLIPRPQSKAQDQRKCAETGEEDGDVSELVQDGETNYQEDWEWLARLLDRIAFLLYFITYVIFISAFL